MAKDMSDKIEHFDVFGVKIKVGDVVVTSYTMTSLAVCRVVRITPKMVKCQRIGTKSSRNSEFARYPTEVCIVDSEAVTMWLLSK